MVKRRGREGRLLGRWQEFHDHPLPGAHSSFFAYAHKYRIGILAHKDYLLCCTSANMVHANCGKNNR